MHRIVYVPIDELKPHEEVKPKKFSAFARFASRIGKNRIRLQPLWIDEKTKVILDGHHRYSVFQSLGCRTVPCIPVQYLEDNSITVLPRKPDIPVSKQIVIDRGLSGIPFPAKTTKHVFPQPAPFLWIDVKKCR